MLQSLLFHYPPLKNPDADTEAGGWWETQIKQAVLSEELGETQDSHEAGTLLNAFIWWWEKMQARVLRTNKTVEKKKLGNMVNSCINCARLTSVHIISNFLKSKGT